MDRDGIHGSPSSDKAASYQVRGNPLNPLGIDAQRTNPSNLANVGRINLAYQQDDAMLAPHYGERLTCMPTLDNPDPNQILRDPTPSPISPPHPPP
ncbi:hypothetical protein Nepgr_021062 [Nepenthes gracilis]|uniref:Uncharacterized protein n=1 Tax=Nepenthes gracilis TaxID=150966 RepID=A0AAD3T078_NEPGR|nr:hypothetical protein Nepgr_021062 [Nepenthes gracilis]